MKHIPCLTLICLFALSLASASYAEENSAAAATSSPAPAAPASPTTNAPTTMDTIVVSDVPLDQSILPTSRPINSVFGTDRNIVDTPRGVSTLTKEQVEIRQIESVNQIGQLASGTYSPSYFGAEGQPTIRGVLADLYINGQRIKSYNNSFPPSFNSMESMNVVKGPGSVVYGPPMSSLGGYLDIITKQPYFDKWQGSLTFQVGDYVPGGASYNRDQWILDTGGPLIKDVLAVRFSYKGREADSYYNNVKDNTEDFYGAVTYMPYKNITMQASGQYYEDKFNEDAGWNRLTTDLINNGTYISNGINGWNGNGPPFYSAPWMGYVNPGPDGTYQSNQTKLYHDQVLVAPGDSAAGTRGWGQLITTINVDDDFTIKNSTYGESTESRKYSDYGYDEYAPSTSAVETRTEFQLNFDTPYIDPVVKMVSDPNDPKSLTHEKVIDPGFVVGNSIDAGFSFRTEHTESYAGFANEPFAVYDISGSEPNPYTFPAYTLWGTDRAIPGKPGYYSTPSSSVISDFYQGGLFYQHDFKITPEWEVIAGGRGDLIFAESGVPALGESADGTIGASSASARHMTSVLNGEAYGSILYKPAKNITIYTTYQRVNGMNTLDNQSAIPYHINSDGSSSINTNDLRLLSVLMEGGLKFSLFNDTLFLGVAGYRQSRYTRAQNGALSAIDARGVEIDSTYQPNHHFSLTSNFTWQEANYKNGTNYAQTGSYQDVFADGVPIDSSGRTGTGVGSPNYSIDSTYSNVPGGYRVSGLPNILFNTYAIYSFDFGLTLGVGVDVTGPVMTDTEGKLWIPAQYTWNGFVSYDWKTWDFRLNVFNFTDERNLTPGAPGFASNDLIYPEEPLHANITIKYKF